MRARILGLGLVVAACGPVVPVDEGAADSSSTGGPAPGTSSPLPPPPLPDTSTTTTPSSSEGSTTSTPTTTTGDGDPCNAYSRSFTCQPEDTGSPIECSTWEQDCGAGEKCMPWANDGGNTWNATKCSPLDPNPDGLDEPCTVEGSGVSGVDSCDLGLMCFNVDPDTNEGTCFAMCQGSEAEPECPTCSSCKITSEGVLNLCLQDCDPITQNCPGDGFGCYFDGNAHYICTPAAGETAGVGSPCEYINGCDPGLFCATQDFVPGCETTGCCTLFCMAGDSCDAIPGTECIPLELPDPGCYGEGVGVCGQP